MILYGHMLSSASYRVRIALGLKGLQVTSVLLDLRGGEQRLDQYLQINSQGFVPALALNDGAVLTQSVAIIEYLDEIHPDPPLLPQAPLARARVRALTQAITCDVHPLNNLRVLQYLENDLRQDKRLRASSGIGTGCSLDSRLSSGGWFAMPRPDASVTGMRPPLPMCAWSPRCSMRGAMRWI